MVAGIAVAGMEEKAGQEGIFPVRGAAGWGRGYGMWGDRWSLMLSGFDLVADLKPLGHCFSFSFFAPSREKALQIRRSRLSGGKSFGAGQKSILCSKPAMLMICAPSKPLDVWMCPVPSESRLSATGMWNLLPILQRLALADVGEEKGV